MKRIYAGLALPLAVALLLSTGTRPVHAGESTYYADHISMCEDACSGLGERGCSCVKLPTIIVET